MYIKTKIVLWNNDNENYMIITKNLKSLLSGFITSYYKRYYKFYILNVLNTIELKFNFLLYYWLHCTYYINQILYFKRKVPKMDLLQRRKLLNDELETFQVIIILIGVSAAFAGLILMSVFFLNWLPAIVESANVKWRTNDVKALNFQCGERRFFFFREGEPSPLCILSPKKSSRLWQRGWNNARVWAARSRVDIPEGALQNFPQKSLDKVIR